MIPSSPDTASNSGLGSWAGWPTVEPPPPVGLIDALRDPGDTVILTHVRPDGDAIGSAVGLRLGLDRLGVSRPTVFAGTDRTNVFELIDPNSRWVERVDHAEAAARVESAKTIVVVDTGEVSRLDPLTASYVRSSAKKLVIDHHVEPSIEADEQWIVPESAATAWLIGDVIRRLGAELDSRIAIALYTGIATDTGFFRHGNSLSESFAAAAVLVRAGASPETIRAGITECSSIDRLRLQGAVMHDVREAAGGRIAYAIVRRTERESFGVSVDDLEGFVDSLRAIGRAQIQLLFVETADGEYKISARSRPPVEVQPVAVEFGGGGHARAAGLRCRGDEHAVVAKVIAAMERALPR